MSWTHIQNSGTTTNGSAISKSITFPSPVAAGDLVIVAVGTNGIVSTIGDSVSNPYTLINKAIGQTFQNSNYLYYSNLVSGASSLQINVSLTNAAFMTLGIDQFTYNSNLALGSNNQQISLASMTTSASCGTMVWSGNGLDYVAFTLANNKVGTLTTTPGFNTSNFFDFNAGVNFGLLTEYKLNDTSGSGSPSVSFSNSLAWSAVGAVFTEISNPTPTPTPTNKKIFIELPGKLLTPTNNLSVDVTNITQVTVRY